MTPEPPSISDEMREHARALPNSWLYVLDPSVDPDAEAPPELVVGAYPVDEHGDLLLDFQHNPAYRPSQVAPPTDPLDAALQDLSAGRGSREAVLALLRSSELLLLDTVGDGLVLHTTPDGHEVVQAFTAPEHAHASGAQQGWRTRRGRELARILPAGVGLQLNPGSAVSVTVPRSSLLR
ncbi:MAG: SseB family protein [Frankiales bacterium]|nr:SseB family protein [Frankiales bacterium]